MFLIGIMKIKKTIGILLISCVLPVSVMVCLPSCDYFARHNTEYPDILTLKEGTNLPTGVLYTQEETTFDCPHSSTYYVTTEEEHQLFCYACRQAVEVAQPHEKSEYTLQGIADIDDMGIRIYVKRCSVCDAKVEFLLSSNYYDEYMPGRSAE